MQPAVGEWRLRDVWEGEKSFSPAASLPTSQDPFRVLLLLAKPKLINFTNREGGEHTFIHSFIAGLLPYGP